MFFEVLHIDIIIMFDENLIKTSTKLSLSTSIVTKDVHLSMTKETIDFKRLPSF